MEEQNTQNTLRGSKEVIGMPVYSIQEGQNLGQVKSLVLDAKEKRLLAMVVEKRRMTKDEKLLPFAALKSVGDDVVTVERGQDLERRNSDPAVMRALRRPVQPLGARCFTAGGKTMGKVEEYYFDVGDGSIKQLEISDGGLLKGKVLVDGEHIIALAPHTVMLADEAISSCRPVENNLLSSMEVARDKAANLSRNTVNLLAKIKPGSKEEEEPAEALAETAEEEAALPEEASPAPLAIAEETISPEPAETAAKPAAPIEGAEETQPEEQAATPIAPRRQLIQVEVLEAAEEEAGQPIQAALPQLMQNQAQEGAPPQGIQI